MYIEFKISKDWMDTLFKEKNSIILYGYQDV